MYCRNCAAPIVQGASNCQNCGTAVGMGLNYCHNCAEPTPAGVAVCPRCGVSIIPPAGAPGYAAPAAQKSKIAAALLAFFLGTFGVHNFYLGYTNKAIWQLLLGTVGACLGVGPFISGIWGIIEGVQILTGSIATDANGVPLAD